MTAVIAPAVERARIAGAAFVPPSLGGRWDSTLELVTQLRPLFRADPSRATADVWSSLTAASAVWIAGDAAQRRRVADLMCAGGRIAGGIAHIAPAGGAAGHGQELRAEAIEGGWRVSGRTSPLVDVVGADLVLLAARTGDGERMLLLWEPASVGVASGERVATAGLTGCPIDMVTLTDVVIDAESGLGPVEVDPWAGASIIGRAVMPALAVAIVDSALHLALPYAQGRRLYQGAIIDLPHARGLLAEARTDLLIADALAATAVRALHATPEGAAPVAAASAYLAPQLLNDAMRNLSVLFGSTFYGSVEPYAEFETMVRDLAAMSLVGLGSLEALTVVGEAGETFSERGAGSPSDRRIFSASDELPRLVPGSLGFGDRTASAIIGHFDDQEIRTLARRRADRLEPAILRLAELRDRLVATTAENGAELDRAGAFALLLAAGACIGTWAEAATDTVASAPEWLEAALVRIESRLTGRRRALSEAAADAGIADIASCAAELRSIAFERSTLTTGTTL